MILLTGKIPQRQRNRKTLISRICPKRFFWQAGFTLIEILIVVMILGVIAGLAVPNFSNLNTQVQLKETAKNISYLMRYAQGRAITKGKTQELTFDAGNFQYQLNEAVSEGTQREGEGIFNPIAGRLGRTFDIPKEITLEIDNPHIRFYPDGKIDRTRIFLHDNRDHYFTVSTQEQTGYVQMYDFKVE